MLRKRDVASQSDGNKRIVLANQKILETMENYSFGKMGKIEPNFLVACVEKVNRTVK